MFQFLSQKEVYALSNYLKIIVYVINKYLYPLLYIAIFLAKKIALSMIIRIFAASVLAKPLNNAQIVRGVFCLYTFEHGESYPLYKTVRIFRKSRKSA